MTSFFKYKLNIKIFLAFILIIIIPTVSSLLFSYSLVSKTINRETKLRLSDSISAYFQELLFIEEDCLKIAAEFAAQKDIGQLLSQQKHNILQQKLIEFYKMDIIDIIEIEDASGKVILRGHNPLLTGDIKVNQAIIKAGLEGKAPQAMRKVNQVLPYEPWLPLL